MTVLSPPPASAQDAFSCIEELDDDQVRYRIRYIEDKLQDGKKHATRWRYTWMGLWLGAGAGMTLYAPDGVTALFSEGSEGSFGAGPRRARGLRAVPEGASSLWR